ncbi:MULTISPECIES: hypothetical protein [unclassified Rickettsia]
MQQRLWSLAMTFRVSTRALPPRNDNTGIHATFSSSSSTRLG